LDTTGHLVWSYKWQALNWQNSNYYGIYPNQNNLLFVTLSDPTQIQLKNYELFGKIVDSSQVDLNFTSEAIQKLLPLPDGTYFVMLNTNKDTRFIKIDPKGQVIWQKIFESQKQITLKDALFAPSQEIMLIGESHYKYYDLTAATKVYFLYITQIDQNGNYHKRDYKKLIANFFNTKKI
jgi:hypothetical protein